MAKQDNNAALAKMPFGSKYNSPTYTNPGDNYSPKDKQSQGEKAKQFFQRKMEWIYSSYLRNDTTIPYSSISDIRTCRLYAQGCQPIAKYRDSITFLDPVTNERKGWMNISEDICPILPKFRQRVIGEFDGMDFGTTVMAIDAYSMAKREDRKLEVLVNSKYKQELEPFKEAIGIQDDKGAMPFEPNNMEETNMLFDMGFEKLQEEVEMDTLCIATEQRSGWNEVKKRIIEDLVDCGWGGARDYTDVVTNLPMVRYVDPENLIVRQTRFNDFSNVTEAGEVVWYTVAQLRMNGFTEEQIIASINSYAGNWGNANWYYDRYTSDNFARYDDFRVAVLDAEFASFDTYRYEIVQKGGREVPYELPFNVEEIRAGNPNAYKKKKSSKGIKKQYQKLYRCKWVIGTDIIFDYGLQYDVQYTQDGYPKSSYSLYRVTERSMISQCIAIADDLQLAILRMRNAIAQAAPAGISVEWSSLVEIAASMKMQPLDVLTIRNHTGNLIFKYRTNDAGQPMQGILPPIIENKGGVGTYLNELVATIDFNINMLREITGINASVDASTPATDALVGTSQMAYQSTMKVLKPILSAYKSIKQRCFSNVVTRWQLARRFYDVSSTTYRNPASNTTGKINISAGIYDLAFENYCEELITDQEKIDLNNACLASMQAAKTGSIGITLSDYIFIKQLISRNNVRAAWLYLAYRELQAQAVAQFTATENQRMNNEGAMMQKQADAETEERKIVLKGTEDRKSLQMEYIYKMQIERMKLAAQPKQPLMEQPKETAESK